MTPEKQLGVVLDWLARRGMEDVPPYPRAAEMLSTRPWPEVHADYFWSLVERLRRMPGSYGHAQASLAPRGDGPPIACLLTTFQEEHALLARPIYLTVRGGRMHLRFRLEPTISLQGTPLDVVLLPEQSVGADISGIAAHAIDNEYYLDIALPPALATVWTKLRVDAAMPFRLLFRQP